MKASHDGPDEASASTTAGQRGPKRNARKEKLVKCVLTRQLPHHPPRDGSRESQKCDKRARRQGKSEQALVRRPRTRGGPLHRSAPGAIFSWRISAFSLAQPKREWGAHCPAGTPAESPGRLITAPTVLQGSGGNPAGGHTGPPLPLPADQLIQRQAVEIRQGNQCGQGRFRSPRSYV